MYKELQKYQWTFYSEDNADKIEASANRVCEYYKLNDAISNYTNEFIRDEELIDNQIGYLKTEIELGGVFETILLEVVVKQTGGII